MKLTDEELNYLIGKVRKDRRLTEKRLTPWEDAPKPIKLMDMEDYGWSVERHPWLLDDLEKYKAIESKLENMRSEIPELDFDFGPKK